MPNIWMVRSDAGERIADFRKGYVALGVADIGDMTNVVTTEQIKSLYIQTQPDARPGKVSSSVAMLRKFRAAVQIGDHVVTYDPQARIYLLGDIESDYIHKRGLIDKATHLRKVRWTGEAPRDLLRVQSRNSLGSTLTLFAIASDVWEDLLTAAGKSSGEVAPDDEREDLEETRIDTKERAHELIKDKILRLDDSQMQELAAAILRAMGFRTRVSPKGSDRGVDVLASPDGLGLQEPRIKVEVKHKPNTAIGSPEMRSFLGGLRPGDRGMYVSTGGFTKEGKYEAERSNSPITLLDLDDLAELTVMHYDTFDLEGRALITLVKVFWPAE